jgi:uncharacterized tellurite resistance protein B-like protein
MPTGTRPMARWLGALARAGIVRHSGDEAGLSVAAQVVGAAKLDELAGWFRAQPPAVVGREQRAAIEVCIWMAHADRHVDPEERYLLRQIVVSSALDDDAADELIEQTHEAPALDDIADRLTHPVLRELLLALTWELARADGRIHEQEVQRYDELAQRLGIATDRAAALKQAVSSLPG